jgi:hypothetical protein
MTPTMMNRRLFVVTASVTFGALWLPWPAQAATGFDLITDEEYARELAARRAGVTVKGVRLVPNAPRISVVTPEVSVPVRPPIDIEIRFAATAPASIAVDSLKILAGVLQIDVTKRILSSPDVSLSGDGLRARSARIPSGDHRFTISIADSAGRVGTEALRIEVLKPA